MHFHHFREQAAWDCPICQALAYVAWAEENNGWAAVDMVGDGYIAQEAKRAKKYGRKHP